MLLCILVYVFHLAHSQTLSGNILKYDYCYAGSSGCPGAACGGAGQCIADAYILQNTCTRSGLGVNQPAYDPNVVSVYSCAPQTRTNFSNLADCQANTNVQGNTTFSSIGYSNFCAGVSLAYNVSSYGQFTLGLGYQLTTTYACPSGAVTGMTFIQDPAPHVCVAAVQSCGVGSPNFIISTACYTGAMANAASLLMLMATALALMI